MQICAAAAVLIDSRLAYEMQGSFAGCILSWGSMYVELCNITSITSYILILHYILQAQSL